MKKVLKFIALIASVAMFAACSTEEPGEDVITTYGGNADNGGEELYMTMIVNETQGTYELFWGEDKKAEGAMFSNGTFTLKNGGSIMSCVDVEGFTFDITVDGKKLSYDNGDEGEDHLSFELKKK